MESLNLGRLSLLPESKIFYAGMGGSSLPGDLVIDYLADPGTIILLRDYNLPPGASSKDLLLCASYSGNTEETLATMEEAHQLGCSIFALSHGGKLQSRAEELKVPFLSIPPCIQPRCASGYFFAILLGLLFRLGRLESKKMELESLSRFLIERQDSFEAKGKEIAAALVDRVPIVYGPTAIQGACRIWKIKFNENSKIQSFFNVFPELNHNEMVGFTRLVMNPTLIYLRPSQMHPRIRKRMEVMKQLLGEKIPILEVELEGSSLLESMFTALAIGDYASYHLAHHYGMDPAPVAMVEDFKKLLV